MDPIVLSSDDDESIVARAPGPTLISNVHIKVEAPVQEVPVAEQVGPVISVKPEISDCNRASSPKANDTPEAGLGQESSGATDALVDFLPGIQRTLKPKKVKGKVFREVAYVFTCNSVDRSGHSKGVARTCNRMKGTSGVTTFLSKYASCRADWADFQQRPQESMAEYAERLRPSFSFSKFATQEGVSMQGKGQKKKGRKGGRKGEDAGAVRDVEAAHDHDEEEEEEEDNDDDGDEVYRPPRVEHSLWRTLRTHILIARCALKSIKLQRPFNTEGSPHQCIHGCLIGATQNHSARPAHKEIDRVVLLQSWTRASGRREAPPTRSSGWVRAPGWVPQAAPPPVSTGRGGAESKQAGPATPPTPAARGPAKLGRKKAAKRKKAASGDLTLSGEPVEPVAKGSAKRKKAASGDLTLSGEPAEPVARGGARRKTAASGDLPLSGEPVEAVARGGARRKTAASGDLPLSGEPVEPVAKGAARRKKPASGDLSLLAEPVEPVAKGTGGRRESRGQPFPPAAQKEREDSIQGAAGGGEDAGFQVENTRLAEENRILREAAQDLEFAKKRAEIQRVERELERDEAQVKLARLEARIKELQGGGM